MIRHRPPRPSKTHRRARPHVLPEPANLRHGDPPVIYRFFAGGPFWATAAFTSALNAPASTLSPSWMSKADNAGGRCDALGRRQVEGRRLPIELTEHDPGLRANRTRTLRSERMPHNRRRDPIENWSSGTGSLQREWRRCGKPTCRCASGMLHGPYWYLRWRDRGRQRRRYVSSPRVDATRAAIEQRRQLRPPAWSLRQTLTELRLIAKEVQHVGHDE
jgi:hypothetical protein